jgi:hypothetical protein
MNLTALQGHRSWFVRAALVLVGTGLADIAAVWFAQRPILWSTLIASSLPLSMAVFVVIPMLREKRKS